MIKPGRFLTYVTSTALGLVSLGAGCDKDTEESQALSNYSANFQSSSDPKQIEDEKNSLLAFQEKPTTVPTDTQPSAPSTNPIPIEQPKTLEEKVSRVKTPTTTLSLSGEKHEVSLKGYKGGEILIDTFSKEGFADRAYHAQPIPEGMIVKISEETIGRELIANSMMFVPYDNSRILITKDGKKVTHKGEIYFPVNVQFSKGKITPNTAGTLEQMTFYHSKLKTEATPDEYGITQERTISETSNNLDRAIIDKKTFYKLGIKEISSCQDYLPEVFISADAEPIIKIDNGRAKVGLRGKSYVPIRGELIEIPKPKPEPAPERPRVIDFGPAHQF